MLWLIKDSTGIGNKAAESLLHRLVTGDYVIVTMEPSLIPAFMRRAQGYGVETAELMVGKVCE
jgi:hypothetical protein